MTEAIPFVDLKSQYQYLKQDIHRAWDEILDNMHLFLGPNQQAFEQEFAKYCGVNHAVGVSDGTTALQLALLACGVEPGDEVITVSHTFVATAEAVLLVGAKPVFVDIDPVSYTMDVNQIESRITPYTRAILPVHLYGQCADMDPILSIAAAHKLAVIEDACQAHGAAYKGRKAGSMGTAAAFSFYFSKNLGAYGEAGMVTTNDPKVARKLQLLRNHGSEIRYQHEELGMNGRMDELQAAVLRTKLPYLEEWNDRRRKLAEVYNHALSDCEVILPTQSSNNEHVYHLYVIRTEERDRMRLFLNENEIGNGVHYPIPVHLQEPYSYFGVPEEGLPVTEAVANQILSLPMYPELTLKQVEQVASLVRSFMTTTVHEKVQRPVAVTSTGNGGIPASI